MAGQVQEGFTSVYSHSQDELIEIVPGKGGNVHLTDKKEIWTPDLYVYNLKEIKLRQVLGQHFGFFGKMSELFRNVLEQSQSLKLKQNGSNVDVYFSFEAEIKVICNPQYQNFPFNRHHCDIAVRN